MARVGLLEDNARIAKLCATMLQFSGHSVEIYEHPRICLHALMLPLAKSEAKIHTLFSSFPALPIEVLILDLQLPEISGLEILRHLQAYAHTRNLPLIFCTASNPTEVSQALRLAPQAMVVEKPFKLDVLASAVLAALGTKKA
ncbi:MAG: hypothetical protein NVS4B1_05840 [Ktedonobacteraceae bacterium]